MKIRATSKLLKLSGIEPVKDASVLTEKLPGEWYASTVSMNRPGKIAIHFLHYPTLITILIPGKSLNKVIPFLPGRISSLLDRHGYSKLKYQFQLETKPEIYATKSRSILAHMNQMKYNIEFHLALAETIETIDFDQIEDIHFDYIFGISSKLKKLEFLLDQNSNPRFQEGP